MPMKFDLGADTEVNVGPPASFVEKLSALQTQPPCLPLALDCHVRRFKSLVVVDLYFPASGGQRRRQSERKRH